MFKVQRNCWMGVEAGRGADAVISAWNTRADLIDMDVLRRVEKILVYHLERARSGDGKYIPCSEFNIGLTENGITDLRAMMGEAEMSNLGKPPNLAVLSPRPERWGA